MEFKDELKNTPSVLKISRILFKSEEATKMSLIVPFFFQLLGYDVFNPFRILSRIHS